MNPEFPIGNRSRTRFLLLALILLLAAGLRFYRLSDMGYRFGDEGYHLMYSILYLMHHDEPFLYFKHGLHLFIAFGIVLFDLDQAGSLCWSAVCGLLTILLFYGFTSQLANQRAALFAAFAMAVSKYILFYHRSNMSDGYALLFFCMTSIFLIFAFRGLGFLPSVSGRQSEPGRILSWSVVVLAGLLIGFCFTVRIQTCLILIGSLFALALTLGVATNRRNTGRFLVLSGGLLLLGGVGYAATMFLLHDNIKWESTVEWYAKNFGIGRQSPEVWAPYPLIHLWSFCGWPLIVIAVTYLVYATVRIRSRGIALRWLLVYSWGLLVLFLYMGLPWPRAHVYLAFYLCIFWGLAMDQASAAVARMSRRIRYAGALGIAILCVLTAGAEIRKAKTLITGKGGYLETMQYLLANGIGDGIVTTHAWPIFRAEHRHLTTVLYEFPEHLHDADEGQVFIQFLRGRTIYENATHMVLDVHIPYACTPEQQRFLQRFCATYPPDMLVVNDFACDPQTCQDAFKVTFPESMFSRYNIVYDLRRFAAKDFELKPLAPFTTNAEMTTLMLAGRK